MASFSSEDVAPDDVVISGIGGIFPQAKNMDELQEKLLNNIDLIEDIEDPSGYREKLGVPCRKGIIQDKDKFDTTFFGISFAQTFRMDSMTWRVLEKTYEAIVDSGHNPADIRNSNTAIIIGSFISESESLWLEHGQSEAGFSIVGHNRSMLANRVSYWLNTKGPSYAMYTEELAGLSGLTQACELIHTNQCDGAVVGTVDIVSRPELVYQYKTLRSWNKDGDHCESNKEKNEYIRSDACVIMYVQRACDAKRIYAKVTHSDYNYYGHKNTGLVRPMSEPMLEFLQRFYEKCGVDPAELSFLETSNSGIQAFEDVEMEAVSKAILSKRRDPLLIGSVKSNLGNTSASSSLCAIVKILIAMKTGVIPANLQYTPSSPHIPALTEGKLKVVTKNTKWNPKYIAINSMDICGGYGHVLLQPYSKQKPSDIGGDGIPRLVCVSGREEDNMEKILEKIITMPVDVEFVRLMQDIHSANIANHNYRGYVIIPSVNNTQEIQHFDGSNRPVWFVFSGMGSQWTGMATQLMMLPVIAETIQECHRILQPKGVDLINIVTTQNPDIFDNILNSFVGIAAMQLALVEFLRLLNIEPDGIIGHSVGELGCAYADGCFTKEQMILAAYYRGLASLEAKLIDGRMAAIGLGYNKVKSLLPSTLDVACHNSDESSTISGPVEDVISAVKYLKSQNVFAREVNTSNIAYHSRYIKPAAPKLLGYLKQIIPHPKPRSPRWHSTSAPRELWDTVEAKYSSAEYHTNNLLNPVLFEETSKYIPKNAILIEIAPHGLLQAILKRSMGTNTVKIPLTQRGNENGLEFLLSAIGKFYLTGKVPYVSALYPPVQFPVSSGTPSISSLVTWNHSKIWRTPETMYTDEMRSVNKLMEINLSEGEYSVLKEYKMNGKIVLPVSAVLIMAWKGIVSSKTRDFSRTPVTFENVFVQNNLIFPENGSLNITLSMRHGSGYFEIANAKEEIIYYKGRVRPVKDAAPEFSREMPSATEEFEELSAGEIYHELEEKGYELGEQLRKIRKIVANDNGSKAIVECSRDWIVSIDSLLQLATIHLNEGKQKLQFPNFIRKVVINPLEPVSGSVHMAVFNKSTHSVRCGGIELSGISTKELSVENKMAVTCRAVHFEPYANTQFENLNDFVDKGVQLFLENDGTFGMNSLMVTELVNGTPNNLGSEVKNYISSYYKSKVVVDTVNITDVQNVNDIASHAVLLASDSTLGQAISILKNHGGFLLARLEHSTKLEIDKSVVVIAEQYFGNRRWLILKKRVPVNEKTSVIFTSQIQFFSFPENVIEDETTKYYLVTYVDSFVQVKIFLSRINGERKNNIKSFRYVFLMDNDAPPFFLNSQFYSEQLSLDLVVNIYRNGTWGSLRHCDASTVSVPANNLSWLKTLLGLNSLNWKSVGINLKYFCSGNKLCNDFSVVDLAGYTASGQKVMCLARVEPGSSQITTSPYLTWPVPDSWSLDDAATVPFAYTLAYYSLFVRTYSSQGHSILVQNAQSYMGQAYVAVAFHLGLKVYTTVSSEKHRQHLKKRFPQLQDYFIFDTRDKSLVVKLQKIRNYNGFNIVVNFLEEPNLSTSANLVAVYGFLFQLCKTEMELRNDFGMASFLKNMAFIGIIPELIFEMNATWLTEIHNLVIEGIKTGVVKPFDQELLAFSQEDEIFRMLHDSDFTGKVVVTQHRFHKNKVTSVMSQKEENDAGTVFMIDRKKSCLIVGDKSEDCILLAEWLVIRGCQSLTICCEERTMSNLSRRHLRLLRAHHHVHIKLLPLEKTYVLQDAMQLLNNGNNTASLAAVFVLTLKDPQLVHLLEIAMSEVEYFALLMSHTTSSVADRRRKRGLPVLELQWDRWHKTSRLLYILGQLDQLLVAMPAQTIYLSIEEKYINNEISSLAEQLPLFLPSSIEDLEDLGDDLTLCKTCALEEVCTKTPRMSHVREIHPLYIVAGLHGSAKSITQVLTRNLMCPAVLVKIPGGTDNLTENVAAVAQDMIEMQHGGGVYNILGVSWGGVYAIELAKQLEALGKRTHVLLLDGDPQTNQAIARHLGEGIQLEVNLLNMLLKLSSNKVHKALMALPDWNSRLHRALSELRGISPTHHQNLCVAIESVYSRINTLLNYSPHETLLTGEVSFILPSIRKNNDCELIKFFQKHVNIIFMDGNHRTILENPEAALVISDTISVDVYWIKK